MKLEHCDRARIKIPQAPSVGEEALVLDLRTRPEIPPFVRQYHFAAEERDWSFDIAWPEPAIFTAIEIEGATWTGGRHTRGRGFENDCLKYNAAVLAGWRLFRFTTRQARSGFAGGFMSAFFLEGARAAALLAEANR